jgi:NADPH:quinone reductase-like Zn-dependent oxidoreductase
MGSPEDFAGMLQIFGDGVRPVVDRIFALEDAVAAMQRLAASDQFGKIVLRVD